ncbi:hypothetical protein JOH51_005082 [Rhizobium leguminosarum]|nr:hypothetical protein [Rhizobium leguminosarum]
MHDIELLARCLSDFLSKNRQFPGFFGNHLETELFGIDDAEEHSAVGDIDRDCPQSFDLQISVENGGKGRRIAECDGPATPILAFRRDFDDPARHVELKLRDRLDHRHHAGLQQHSRDADRIRPRHRNVFGRFHDDGASDALRVNCRYDEIDVTCYGTARFANQQLPDMIVFALHCHHALHHRRAGRGEDATNDDIANFTFGVATDDIY